MHNKGEFIHHLQANVGTIDRGDAEKILASVLNTLRGRLSPQEASHVEAQLPPDMREVWRGEGLQKVAETVHEPNKLKYDEFMAKIAEETGLSRDGAEEMTKAVFHLLKSQITDGEAYDVLSELPKRLQVAWIDA